MAMQHLLIILLIFHFQNGFNSMETRYISLFNRYALFIVYFWFGFLKIIGYSPAHDLVTSLADVTISSIIPSRIFVYFLGYIECAIGVIWLFPKFTKVAFWVLTGHLVATFFPTFMLADIVWAGTLTPSLVGQYIIKNVVIFASAYTVFVLYRNKIALS
jgi:uncharacterized membrane protein YkgB